VPPSPALLRDTPRYPATTNDYVTIIEHGCLPRGDGKLGVTQHDAGAIGSHWVDIRRHGLMPVANLYGRVDYLCRWEAHPVQTLNAKCGTQGSVPRPHYHRVMHWIEACHVQRLGCSHTQATSLPHGIKRHAMVRANGFTGRIDYASWLYLLWGQTRA
jgi:hypothetical protein